MLKVLQYRIIIRFPTIKVLIAEVTGDVIEMCIRRIEVEASVGQLLETNVSTGSGILRN